MGQSISTSNITLTNYFQLFISSNFIGLNKYLDFLLDQSLKSVFIFEDTFILKLVQVLVLAPIQKGNLILRWGGSTTRYWTITSETTKELATCVTEQGSNNYCTIKVGQSNLLLDKGRLIKEV